MLRRLAGDDPEVNEEWNCDKGRWAFTYATQPDVITTPLIRDTDGNLVRHRGRTPSWQRPGLQEARGCTGVLVGGGPPGRMPTPTPSSRESPWTAMTSTSGPAALAEEPTSWRTYRGTAGNRQLRRPGIRAGGVAGRVRAGRRVADRVLAAA
ncbi:NADH-quinone oxidoreductase domain protein [Mycobacterium ulcerans str. Harvey]|uniref:NADH-quinone oxidoreductase domain protein n=1 Tax=Mycobacterium ulcerans str. Harvey TaxID=1299332 RepID=A0ABN0RA48_MYCUL|nr:NADH-quinone oxidoreductase domain protein [Mycobacterium ulcerans str. Harvey]